MAQSVMARSPLGVNFFWEKGHQPDLDWDKWISTVKLTIMVKENIQIEKLLQPKPGIEDLDYPAHRIMNHRNQTKPLPRKGNANSETKKGEPIGKMIAK